MSLEYIFVYRKMPIKEYHYDRILEELGLSKEEVMCLEKHLIEQCWI